MINTYEFEAECGCPDDGKPNIHQVTVVSRRTIPATDILAVIEETRTMVAYQEDMTLHIGRKLRASVTVAGCHDGIRITSRYGPQL